MENIYNRLSFTENFEILNYFSQTYSCNNFRTVIKIYKKQRFPIYIKNISFVAFLKKFWQTLDILITFQVLSKFFWCCLSAELLKLPGKKGRNDFHIEKKKYISSIYRIRRINILNWRVKSSVVDAAFRFAQNGVVESVGITDDRGFEPITICGPPSTWIIWTAHRSSQRSWRPSKTSFQCPSWTYGKNL